MSDQKTHTYNCLVKQLKRLLLYYVLLLIGSIVFCLTVYLIESHGADPFKDYIGVMSVISIPGLIIYYLLIISIYKMAKELNKNARAWVITCMVFSGVIFYASFYFSIIALFKIIKIKYWDKGLVLNSE